MVETDRSSETWHEGDHDISMFAVGALLLRRRATIAALVFVGGLVGLASGLMRSSIYRSDAIFVPQASDALAPSGISALASQLGVRIPSSGASTWGPALYVWILKSRMMLEPLALDTLTVPELGSRRIAVMDLLEIDAPLPELRPTLTVRALGKMISATEDSKLNVVRLSVESQWPSVSLAMAKRLVAGVNAFNLQTRQSQAVAERQFVAERVSEAHRALRTAEDGMQLFLQNNRMVEGSPQLTFELDRLRRTVMLRQQIYTTLVANLEEASIRAVRDVPVITVLEEPHLALLREPRGTVRRGLIGSFIGLFLGLFFAFAADGITSARRSADPEAKTFLNLVDDATPAFLKRRLR